MQFSLNIEQMFLLLLINFQQLISRRPTLATSFPLTHYKKMALYYLVIRALDTNI
jgi:hypothetical protein